MRCAPDAAKAVAPPVSAFLINSVFPIPDRDFTFLEKLSNTR